MEGDSSDGRTETAQANAATCNACKQGLDEARDESVVSFGKYLFHRCAKCHSLVEHNTNLLLLSDGGPVCENCSYMCTICLKPIHNEAIVTGDESYHADCFRCRSCSNKIEELIFAKTNQGIWCMACHNDRVARTRRHAEAKRRARKDRDNKSGRTTQSRPDSVPTQSYAQDSSGVSREASSPPTPTRSTEAMDTPPRQSPVPIRPLPAAPELASSTFAEGRLDIAGHPTAVDASSSAPGVTSYALDLVPDSPASHVAAATAETPVLGIIANPESIASMSTSLSHPMPGSADVFVDSTEDDPASQSGLSSGISPGLSVPAAGSKAHNRRSGFYGAMARPVPPPPDPTQPDSRNDVGDISAAYQTASPQSPSRDISTPRKVSATEAQQPPVGSSSDLAPSTSFYDADTLLFLTHVTSASPGSPFRAVGDSVSIYSDVPTPSTPHEESLDSGPSPRVSESHDVNADIVAASKPSETARRVRASLHLSQRESVRSSLAELDVELVETLLAELEATQREIKEIKIRYNAFRRASRSAFEGFRMAREEYDKEVAARREVESQMVALRAKFAEQAHRLAQLDHDQTAAEELKRQSKSLRTSVIGMEKHLSELRAEVALSTAQAAELAALDSPAAPDNRVSESQAQTASQPADLAECLNLRLESVKESHRVEIGTLVAERDALLREIEQLKTVRDAHAAEAAALASRNADLFARDQTAARNFGNRQGSTADMSTSFSRLGEVRGHVSSLSTSSTSTAFSPIPARSATLAPRQETVSATDVEPAHKQSTAETVSRNKFWGKSKTRNESLKQSTSQVGVASPPSDKSPGPSLRGTAKAESFSRAHLFQQSSILRPVRCDYCGDKMWGLNEVRCSACGSYAHAKCAAFLQTHCVPSGTSLATVHAVEDHGASVPPSGSMFGAELAVQAEKEGSSVPAIVIKCIDAVEQSAMSYEGIYRKTGGMGQTKIITQNFERGQSFDLSDRDKYNDIAAVTSCLKNYFRSLPNPLMTHDLHEDFIAATALSDPAGRLDAIEQVLRRLPSAHYDTARHLFLHLNRVQARAAENKMTAANLGVVFGPTVLRSPVAAREWSDMGPKTKLVEILCEHAERLFSPS
ncbi:hypothetical protein JCM10908_006359 [Rhodotorula pacifica]|uniref:uncharacterized protein n=1 Tax=Rhodotorula pacifica TaxID=1495444 RepID=UPI00316EFC84